MFDLARLTDTLIAANLPVGGVSLSAGKRDMPGSTWYERAEGWFRVDWSNPPTSQQDAQAGNLITAFNPAPTTGQQLDGLGGRVLAALCLLSSPSTQATANQKAAAQAMVDAVAGKVIGILPQ